MEPPLIRGAARRPHLKIVAARALQEIGWAGCLGCALCAVAALAALEARELRATSAQRTQSVAAPLRAPTAEPQTHGAEVRVARRDDVPLLLARIERAATASGLPWSAADYRIVPATDRQSAVLEVRCAFKAPYPRLRSLLSELVATLPAMTFREMTFSRPRVELPEVDAKFAIAVFLVDDAPPAASIR